MKSECRHIIINPQGEHGGKETLGLEGYRVGVRKWILHTSCKVLHNVLYPKAQRNGSKKKKKSSQPSSASRVVANLRISLSRF